MTTNRTEEIISQILIPAVINLGGSVPPKRNVENLEDYAFLLITTAVGLLSGIGGGGDITLPLAIDEGGTGSTTAVAALAALGVPSRLDQLAAPISSVSMGGQVLASLATPSSSTDATTKAYVDALQAGLSFKASCRVASTANLDLSSPGASIDSVSLSNGDRVLVKNQSTGSQNGIYVWNGASSAMSRAGDADISAEVKAGLWVLIEEGSSQADTGWLLTTDNPITVGTTALTFTQFPTLAPVQSVFGRTGAIVAATNDYTLAQIDGAARVGVDYILLQDQKSSGTLGGAFSSGSWQTRTLNTEVWDTGSHCTLSSNQITLAAGAYRFCGSAPGLYVDSHQCRLYNISDGVLVELGTSEYSQALSPAIQNRSFVSGRFNINNSRTFELQHRCVTTNAANGFGTAGSFGTEVYAQIEFWRERG